MASVEFKNVSKVFDKTVKAVDQVNLTIKDKEFVVFVGPSGCGKSTCLRMIAGLDNPTEGEIYIGDRLVNEVSPKDRDIAMVFQSYALYPHMTVYDNIAYGLKLRHFPKTVIDEKVKEAAKILDIESLLNRKPKALSGGQRQRVAIGRAIVREPQVFLMDEPLSNLDAKLRNQMRSEILQLRKKLDTTFVYVTHDQTEAMTLGDRIVVIKDGVVQQIGSPQDVFSHPTNMFVAGFIGTPQMNFFDGCLKLENDKYCVYLGNDFEYKIIPSEEKQNNLKASNAREGKIVIGIRPEHIIIADEGIPATMDVIEMTGSSLNLHFNILGKEAIAVVPGMDEKGHFYDEPKQGESLRVLFNENAVHLFDTDTQLNIEYN